MHDREQGMNPFSNFWDDSKAKFKDKFLYIFLDFDGTLTRIVNKPQNALLRPEVRESLKRLSRVTGVQLAIVSGRALPDVRERVGVDGLIYVGNHGMEMEGRGIKFSGLITPRIKNVLGIIKSELPSQLKPFKGVLFEDKGPTFSVHYRLARASSIPAIEEKVQHVTGGFVKRHLVKIVRGKKVFDIRPDVEWDKGRAVSWLLKKKKEPGVVFYFGDDVTDEDAFRVLRHKGVTVLVGPKWNSSAEYHLKDHRAVGSFLREIVDLKNGEG